MGVVIITNCQHAALTCLLNGLLTIVLMVVAFIAFAGVFGWILERRS